MVYETLTTVVIFSLKVSIAEKQTVLNINAAVKLQKSPDPATKQD